MSLFNRTYTFTDGVTAYGSQVENEFNTVYTTLNNLNTSTTNWGQVSILNTTGVPLVADCSNGSQDIADFKNNSVIKASIGSDGTITTVKTSNQLVLGTTNTVTISSTAPSSSRTYTMPDVGGSGTFPFLELAQTFTGKQTLSAAAGNPIHGTNTNDSASAGYVGEYIQAVTGSTNFPTSTQYGDLGTGITLTAGDWDVTCGGFCDANGSTWSQVNVGISTTSGNSSAGLNAGENNITFVWASSSTTPLDVTLFVASYRMSVSGSTPVYHKIKAVYTGGPPTIQGRISARRVR